MPTDGWLAIGEQRLHYLDWGSRDRPAVLFLHGSAAHAHWWDFVIPPLADRYRCVALDLRGHGDSSSAPDGDYRLEAHAGDVAAVIAALELPGATLVGHSFGGLVAMLCAGQTAADLAALAVIDSRIGLSPRSIRLLGALRRFPPPRYATLDEALTRFRLLPADTTAPESVLRHVARHAVTPTADGSWVLKGDRRALGGANACDLSAGLAASALPLLVVRGGRSTVVDAAALAAFRTAAPQAELAEIAEAHHHIMLDQPAALTRLLGDFLDRQHGVR